METALFLGGAAIASAALTYFRAQQRHSAEQAVEKISGKKGPVKAPFIVGDPTEVDHFTVTHLKELFEDVPEFER